MRPVPLPRVVMLVGAYHPEVSGGGLQCRTLIHALRGSVICSVVATTRRSDLPLRDEVDGVPVHRIVVRGGPRGWLGAGTQLLRILYPLRDRVDIIHFHGFTAKMMPAYAFARLCRLRIVQKATSVGGDDPVTLARTAYWPVYSRADAFVSVSAGMTARFGASRLPASKVREIPNGVDLGRFRPAQTADEMAEARARLNLPGQGPIVVFVGFFSRDKAPHVLFEAWRRLPGPLRGRLVFIGSTDPAHVEVDSDLVAWIRNQVKLPGVHEHVRFVERTDAIHDYFRACDIYAAPSRREGLSNALLEAVASGVPVVAARLDGVTTDAVTDGETGFLVPVDDPESFAERLARLLGDEPLRRRLGAAARRLAEKRFDIETVAAAYQGLYRELLA
jgi:glycosyltransferase involved in cell wall biosynthesis